MSAKDDRPFVWAGVLLALAIAIAVTCASSGCMPPAPPWLQPYEDPDPRGPCIATSVEQRGAATLARCEDGRSITF